MTYRLRKMSQKSSVLTQDNGDVADYHRKGKVGASEAQ